MIDPKKLNAFIDQALKEDIGSGDYTTLACIPPEEKGRAQLVVKGNGLLAGVKVAEAIFTHLDPGASMEIFKKDGDPVEIDQIAFEVEAKSQSILKATPLVLNCMQRMSGIATLTDQYIDEIYAYPSILTDTMESTPLFRLLEKEAVRIGGAKNQRDRLDEMIFLTGNHIDFCGEIRMAIEKTSQYIKEENLNLPLVIQARNMEEVKEILKVGQIDRIMLFDFKPRKVAEALRLIDGQFETGVSGNINLSNLLYYARNGVDYIAAGSLIHQAKSFALELKKKKDL